MRTTAINNLFAMSCLMMLALSAMATGLPDVKTGGAKGGPIAVLFLSERPTVFPTYGDKLTARGFVYATANYLEPLSPDFLRQFNVFVFDELPAATYDYHAGIAEYRRNMTMIRQYVDEGAGLLAYAGYNAGFIAGWNREMRSYGINARHSGILDPSVGGLAPWRAYIENSYGWTCNLNATHPVTAGLQRIYYPMGELNGTATYPTLPMECDARWTPLVKTMAGAHLTIFIPPAGPLALEPDPPAEYTLCAVRETGKGRVGALAISPEFTHRGGYGAGQTVYELNLGNPNGIVLEKGDGTTPSDAGEMLMRLYAWLGEKSVTAGFGGYVQGTPLVKRDPLPPPPPQPVTPRFKALIGPRTKYSDGAGTVAEYARMARQAGYSLLVFTETFTRLKAEQWVQYATECAENSDDTLTVLPGFDIQDVEGSRFIYIAPPYYPHKTWLDEDGKRLLNPYTLNFFYTRHMVILHRANSSAMPTERLKHFQGLSVYTYRDGKLVDNSLDAFIWEVHSASFPVPIVVHELFSPAEVAPAAAGGYQQYLPEADSAADAVNRFCRQGMDNPTHPLISEGPLIEDPVVITKLPDPRAAAPDKAEQTFRLALKVSADRLLKKVTLYDGYTPVRRWLPDAKAVALTADFPFSHQYAFWVLAEDQSGRQGLRSTFWISPARSPGYFRCTDRQNWLGHTPMYYTGAFLPFGGAYGALCMPIKGTDEGSSLFTQMPGACMATKIDLPFICNDVVISDFILDEKYVEATFNKVGLSATPSRASKPTSVYTGRVRHYSFTQSTPSEPWVAMIEYDLTLKRPVEPLDPAGLFPAVAPISNDVLCWSDGHGGFTQGKYAGKPSQPYLAVPRGGLAGGIIPLDDSFALRNGCFGRVLPGAPDYLPAGTRLTGRFLVAGRSNEVGSYDGLNGIKVSRSFADAPQHWLKAMGFAGDTPYKLVLTRGTLGPIGFIVSVTPDQYGVAGEIRQTAVIPYQVPLQITGLNPRWSAGSWREGDRVQFTGVFNDTAWPRLDVSKPGKFFAGNLLTADNPKLVLTLVKWDANTVSIEAHNPTNAPIAAIVTTQPDIAGYKSFTQPVTVSAGSTVYLGE